MADTNNNINIDISGDTANMATDYGLSGVSLGDAHVGISKIVWGDHTEGNRVTLSNALPVLLTGSTGPIEIRGKVGGETNDRFQVSNYINTTSTGKVGYDQVASGTHHTEFVAVAGNTSGQGYGAYIAVTGSVQGLANPEDANPIVVTGPVDAARAMAQFRNAESGRSGAMGIMVQGVEAGLTASVNGEVFPGYGFGVPIATTGGRRLGFETDSIRIDNSTIGISGGRELSSATDSVKVFGYDGRKSVRTILSSSEDGITAGYSGDALKVAIVNAAEGITFSIAVQNTMGVTNGTMPPLRIQGYPTSDSGSNPVTVRGENAGALEVYSSSGMNTSVVNTVEINDTNITSSLEDSDKPLNSKLAGIKSGTDILPTINTNITSGNLTASISEIQKPTSLRSGTKTVTTQASTVHQNLEIKSGVTVKSDPKNTGMILVGNSSLVNNDTNGFLLEPGESVFLEINNLNKVYAKADGKIANQKLYYIGS